jgi:hypothetical protein
MVVDTLFEVLGIGGVAGPVRVLLSTVIVGLGAKAGGLLVWRNTDALLSTTTYLQTGALLGLATLAVVAGTQQGVLAANTTSQTVYALILAKLVEQSLMLVRGG